MLIIPAVSFGKADSLFKVLIDSNYDPREFLGQIYYSDSAFFYIALIIQQGCLSASFYVTRLNDLLSCYLSPWLADYKRKYMSDSMPWRRPAHQTFQYGYFYAQMMTIFWIVLIFSSTVPIITLMGALYLCIKHGVDSFNLLTMHRKELESKSEMFDYILFTGQIILLLYQCCLLVFFSSNDMNIAALVVILTIIITIVVWKRTNAEVFNAEAIPSLIMVEKANQSLELSEASVSKWRREYSHPLLLISSSHPAQAYQVEVVNDQQLRKLSRLTFNGHPGEYSENSKRNSIDRQNSFKRSSALEKV